jgi:hypothetical protein
MKISAALLILAVLGGNFIGNHLGNNAAQSITAAQEDRAERICKVAPELCA